MRQIRYNASNGNSPGLSIDPELYRETILISPRSYRPISRMNWRIYSSTGERTPLVVPAKWPHMVQPPPRSTHAHPGARMVMTNRRTGLPFRYPVRISEDAARPRGKSVQGVEDRIDRRTDRSLSPALLTEVSTFKTSSAIRHHILTTFLCR